MKRRQFVTLCGSLALGAGSRAAFADDKGLKEPVHRVAKAPNSVEPTPVHPLDRALDIARSGLAGCRKNIDDYTAILIKRERIDDVLGAHVRSAQAVRLVAPAVRRVRRPRGPAHGAARAGAPHDTRATLDTSLQ